MGRPILPQPHHPRVASRRRPRPAARRATGRLAGHPGRGPHRLEHPRGRRGAALGWDGAGRGFVPAVLGRACHGARVVAGTGELRLERSATGDAWPMCFAGSPCDCVPCRSGVPPAPHCASPAVWRGAQAGTGRLVAHRPVVRDVAGQAGAGGAREPCLAWRFESSQGTARRHAASAAGRAGHEPAAGREGSALAEREHRVPGRCLWQGWVAEGGHGRACEKGRCAGMGPDRSARAPAERGVGKDGLRATQPLPRDGPSAGGRAHDARRRDGSACPHGGPRAL